MIILCGGIILSVFLGDGEYRYKVVDNWAKLPENWTFTDVAGVAVNSNDEVFVFNRGQHPMIIFDIDGNYLRSWGDDLFSDLMVFISVQTIIYIVLMMVTILLKKLVLKAN